MIQTVVCAINNCGFRGSNGFCLNRVTSIGQDGVCSWLKKVGWDQKIEERYKNVGEEWFKCNRKETGE